MAVPLLGQLAIQRGLLDAAKLESLLARQQAARAKGRFVRLGELLRETRVCRAPEVRELLAQQHVTIVRCARCGARYDAVLFQGQRRCLRCCAGPLQPAPLDDDLAVEDVLAEGPQAQAIEQGFLARANARLGPFLVLGEIGRGAMGVVYKARDTRSGQVVALKLLLRQEELPWEEVTRFRREAEAIARLDHPNVVRCHGLEEHQGRVCMVLEFLRGAPLDQLCVQGLLDLRALVGLAAQVGRALEGVHAAGLVHRDIKPGNVVVDTRGLARLVDFGIAKSSQESVSLTLEDQVLGSLPYIAPEYVLQGVEALDALCDVYALGVLLYATLSGARYPYGDPQDEQGYVVHLIEEAPAPLAQWAPQLDPGLVAIVTKAIAKERAERHPSAAALAAELEEWLARARLSQ